MYVSNVASQNHFVSENTNAFLKHKMSEINRYNVITLISSLSIKIHPPITPKGEKKSKNKLGGRKKKNKKLLKSYQRPKFLVPNWLFHKQIISKITLRCLLPGSEQLGLVHLNCFSIFDTENIQYRRTLDNELVI